VRPCVTDVVTSRTDAQAVRLVFTTDEDSTEDKLCPWKVTKSCDYYD